MIHTKEPWRAEKVCEANYEIYHDHGTNQIEVTATAITKENARRIVACVNACAGIPSEDLERYYNAGGGIDEAMEEASLRDQVCVVKQRDELLAALSELTSTVGLAIDGATGWDAHKNARALLARLKEGAPKG